MFDDSVYQQIKESFQRILALPITKSTYRELRNSVIQITENDGPACNKFFDALITGNFKGEKNSKPLQQFIDQFGVTTRVAKDIYERGEVLTLISSETLANPNFIFFRTLLKRIDGAEFEFLTDPVSTVMALKHFLARLQELDQNDKSKKYLNNCKAELQQLREMLEEITVR